MKQKIIKKVENGEWPGVYKITNKRNGKIYIGQTKLAINERLTQHCNSLEATSGIDLAINQEGSDNFIFEAINPMYIPDTEQLWFSEQYFISFYESNKPDKGYNLTKGNHVEKFADFVKRYNKDFFAVPTNMFKHLEDVYNINFKDQEVLLINRFDKDTMNHIKWFAKEVNQIYLATDDKNELGEYIKKELDNYMNKDNLIIISNPPYGRVGAEITKKIIDNINYKQFINILPVNDYKRVEDLCLWQHFDLDNWEVADFNKYGVAGVTSSITSISKRAYNISKNEFEVETYIDPQLKKYFYGNISKKHYAIDAYKHLTKIENKTTSTSAIFAHRDIAHGHMPYSKGEYTKDTLTYQWNIEGIDYTTAIDNFKTVKNNGDEYLSGYVIEFNTEIEKVNFVNFIYTNRLFTNKLFRAVNVDSYINASKLLPKVDWSRSWTVEEVLKEYNYTDEEVKAVMESLNDIK